MSGIVVFENGLMARAVAPWSLRSGLAERGLQLFSAPVARHGFDTVARDARALSDTVQVASAWGVQTTGSPAVTLVGYSKGGVTAQAFLSDAMAGAEHVDRAITVASPVRGTEPIGVRLSRLAAAYVGLAPVRELVPQNPIMRGIERSLQSGRTATGRALPELHSIVADIDGRLLHGTDGFIKTREATLPDRPGMFNHVVRGASHVSVIDDPRVHDLIAEIALRGAS